MKITITTTDDNLFTLDVAPDIEVENFKALIEMESNISASDMILLFDGKPIMDGKRTLNFYGMKDGDMVLVNRGPSSSTGASAASSAPSAASMDAQFRILRDTILADPVKMNTVKSENPALFEAIVKGADEFKQEMERMERLKRAEEDRQRRMMTADPFDPEAQKLIAEEIQRQNIENNMKTAMEYHPENYGTVNMLYINVIVNGHAIQAFVDSGAQSTIMSKACAEKCNITRLIDPRWSGIAKGVGTQRIAGRIHLCDVQIEKDFLATSFTILEKQPMDVLLGLDMLKRHQCVIDLKDNVLIIGTTGTRTKFLNEGDITEKMDDSADEGASSSTSTSTPKTFDDVTITEIISLGFSREDAIAQLTIFDGDKEKAIAALSAKSLNNPS